MTPSQRIARNAKPREHDIRKALDKRVAEYDGVTRAVAWLGRAGAPDVIALFPSCSPIGPWAVFIETKMTGGVLSVHQKTEHEILRIAGCEVRVIATMAQLDEWLKPR